MALMKVLKWPDQALETPAEPIEVFDEELKILAGDMHQTMDHAGGIGLAANQVGVLKQIMVIYIPWMASGNQPSKPWHKSVNNQKKHWNDQRFTMVNPEITEESGEVHSLEGCLSFPSQMDYVGRSEQITVRYYDVQGHQHSLTAGGLMSVCVQHEIDHLRGIVFTERMNKKVAERIHRKMLAHSS